MSTVLIVDDTAVAREPLARLLRYEGFDTVCATNGLEALAHVREGPVDLVLLDVMMPKMDGVRFLEVLRADPRGRELPVILLTGSMDESHVARAGKFGLHRVFQKARFAMDDLSASIREGTALAAGRAGGVAGGVVRRCVTLGAPLKCVEAGRS